MKKLYAVMIIFLMMFFAVSCGDDSKNDSGWENQDKEVNDADAGGTDDTGNTGDLDVADTSDESDQPNLSDESNDSTQPDQSDESEDLDNEIPDEDTAADPLLEQFVGTWAQKIILKSSSTSLIGNVPSVTTRYVLVDMTIKDGKLSIDRRNGSLCQTDNETGNNIASQGIVLFNEPSSKFNTVYYYWKPNQIPGQEDIPDVNITEEAGKVKFVTNKEWELRGATMTDPATEEMISSEDDSRIFDQDEDGHAAFTIIFNGTVNGPIYYVQRVTAIYDGKLVSEGKIEGNVEWTDEQYTHPDTPDVTLRGQKTTVTDKDKSVFQFVKVDASMTCDTLIAQKSTLFDLVNPNTNPDGDPDTDD